MCDVTFTTYYTYLPIGSDVGENTTQVIPIWQFQVPCGLPALAPCTPSDRANHVWILIFNLGCPPIWNLYILACLADKVVHPDKNRRNLIFFPSTFRG